MYILQECENKNGGYWFDKYKSGDYKFICEMCRNYADKFKDKLYRVVEVFIYV